MMSLSRPRSRASSVPDLPPSVPPSPLGMGAATPSSSSSSSSSSGAVPAYHRWWGSTAMVAASAGSAGASRRSSSPHPLKAIERARRRASFLLLTASLAVLGCLGVRCLYAASLSSSKGGAGLNGSWRYGRYHDHVSGLEPGAPAYRDLLAEPGTWAAHPSATQVQCPAFNASLLPSELWAQGLYVAANLRDNEGVMANLIQQLAHLARLFSPTGTERRLFVSVYESNSGDATPQWLEELRAELTALGVPHEVVSGGAAEARTEVEDRIAFLARMRNRAMAPLYEGRAWAGPGQDERFGHVVFVNDVYFCAYEVLRLLMYGADLACGLDLFLEPDPDKYARKGQPEAAEIRRELTFYDLWVARDIRGRRFQWAPPFVENVAPAEGEEAAGSSSNVVYSKRRERGWETETEAEADAEEADAAAPPHAPLDHGGPLSLPEHREAFPAFCCWNGLAVLRAEPFYRGLRFRSTRPGQGVLSECSNLCLDLWANGYSRVVVDPQVKLAYDEPTYERIQAALPPRYPDLYRVRRPRAPATPPAALSTCYLETGARKQGSMVRFEECRDDFPTATTLAQARPRFADLCFEEKRRGLYWGEDTEAIPRALLQLAPFPFAAHEAAMDEAHAAPGAAAVPWYQRWRLGKQAARRVEAQRVLALARGPREWRALWDDWRRMHVDAPARCYGKEEAEAVVRRHLPLAGPVLRRLEARGDWAAWRTLASLALLYHHGGVLVPPARYRPLRSLDCVLFGGKGLQVDLQAAHPGLVEEVGVEGSVTGGAWGPDVGLLAAPRHDTGLRRAVERLFSFEGGAEAGSLLRGRGSDWREEEEEEAVRRVLREAAAAGDVR